ncbi:tail completion protein gp17 [Comamonas terrigena]|uniref:tail completion protein gp17 n=1 Tax=Comamonas terrigena TaxID=32013 RepID=UPI0035E3E2EC
MEVMLREALESVCGAVFPSVAPHGATGPYIIWQRVGGRDTTYLDNSAGPRNSRVQISVWSLSKFESGQLLERVDAVLREHEEMSCKPTTSPFDAIDGKLYGVQQTWGIWS